MKKYTVCAIAATAVLAVSGMNPSAAYGATASYNIPGGKMIVVGGNLSGGMISGNGSLGAIIGGSGSLDCETQFPTVRPDLPEINWPVQPDLPDSSQPDLPDSSQPDNSQPDNSQPDKPDVEKPGNGSSQDAFAEQVVALVNEERAKAGLSPLTIHSGAVSAAQIRAGEIQTQFSHTRPNGSSFSTALTQAGVSYRGSGENIAYGQSSPEQVMQSWMNSAGHRANILNSNYTAIGVGHAKNAAGVDYWVQLFIN